MLSLILTPAGAQFGNLGKAIGKAAEERQGASFSTLEKSRWVRTSAPSCATSYGVVQDQAVHKSSLVGSLWQRQHSRTSVDVYRPRHGWHQCFAAPGGFVHITRGALALMQNEAELADVLAHEISHVTAKHTVKAIQKSKAMSIGAKATRSEVISQAANQGYEILLENNFDRGDEMDADKSGVSLANGAGYAPGGLSAFLTLWPTATRRSRTVVVFSRHTPKRRRGSMD
jgi:Zn-dependent protease with chaperone function